MVSSPKYSPARRRSIAVLNMSDSKSKSGRRRAYSIAPGDKLSPLSRSRRSLKPRKSILKRPSVAPDDITQPMDLTMIQRRVSFADKSQVRLYDRDRRDSEGSPPSSPGQDAEQNTDQPPPVVNDENAYPGASKFRPGRRSSLRRSFGTDIGAGEESMELDTTKIIAMADELRLADESWGGSDEEEDYDGDDMDMTEIVRRQSVALRRRSSMHRQSLAPPEEVDQDRSLSEVGGSEDDRPHTDFTVPLGQPLRKPEPPPEEWHALRAVTHAGANDSISEDGDTEPNELDNAISRLIVARDSLGLSGDGAGVGDNSFASTESDSFTQNSVDFANADRTVDITSILRRASSGTFTDPSQASTSEYSDSRSHDTDERINLPVDLPQENPSPSIYPDLSKVTSSIPTRPTPLFQKPTSVQPIQSVFKPPTAETPKAVSFTASNVFKPRPLERQSVFSLQKPSAKSNISSMASIVATDTQPQKRPIAETEKPVEERPTPGKKQATSHLAGPSTSRASSAPPEESPSKGTTPTPSSPGKKAGLTSNPRKPGFPARGRTSSVSGLRRTSASFTHGQKPSTAGPTMVAFGSRVPAPVRGRKSAPGDIPSPSKKASSLPPDPEELAPLPPAFIDVQEPQDEEDMELEQSDEAPEPARLPPSRSPSPPSRAKSPAAPSEEDEREPGEKQLEIEITPPEDDGATGRWRDEVTMASNPESAEEIHISIEQFLVMTGTEFMEHLVAPRRSSIHPSLLASSSTSDNAQDIPLADFVVAMFVDLPHWTLYDEVSKDLQERTEAIKEFYQKAEEDVKKDTPDLFREFVESDDSFKEALIPHLNLLRVNEKAQVRSQWYDWKFHWVNELLVTAEAGFNQLAADATFLERINQESHDLLVALRKEYEEVMAELKKDEEEVAEIESCDQGYLNDLKRSLAEQSVEVDGYRTDVSEALAKLERLNMRSSELDEEQKEAQNAIAECERIIQIQNSSTKEEVFRLKDKLEGLQDLHLWKAKNISSGMAQFLYAGRFSVSIPCVNFVPIVSRVTIDRLPLPGKRQDPFPALSDLTLQTAVKWVRNMGDTTTNREIVTFLSDYWTSIVQLRTQLNVIETRYPVAIEIIPQDDTAEDLNTSTSSTSAVLATVSSFKATVKVVDLAARSKVLINFLLDFGIFAHWPMALKKTKCEVEVVVGPFNPDNIRVSVTEYLSQVTQDQQHGCLLDAIEAALPRL